MVTTLGIIVAMIVALAGFMGGIIAFLIKYALVPYLEKRFLPYMERKIVAPLAETHKQVTENNHANEQPTVLDRISEVKYQGDRIERLAKDAHDEVTLIGSWFDRHLEHSDSQDEALSLVQKDVDKIWKRLREKETRNEHG